MCPRKEKTQKNREREKSRTREWKIKSKWEIHDKGVWWKFAQFDSRCNRQKRWTSENGYHFVYKRFFRKTGEREREREENYIVILFSFTRICYVLYVSMCDTFHPKCFRQKWRFCKEIFLTFSKMWINSRLSNKQIAKLKWMYTLDLFIRLLKREKPTNGRKMNMKSIYIFHGKKQCWQRSSELKTKKKK